MGLGIKTKNKRYHRSYSALHRVRELAGDESAYPNLINHSDCSGDYTINGQPGDEHLEHGNLAGLIVELKTLKKRIQDATGPLDDLLACAMDALDNNEPLEFS